MSNKTFTLTEPLYQYLLDVSLREPECLRRIREETASHELAVMQISPEQGQFMAMLVRLIGAKRCLEIGVFTGYSTLSVALALPGDGKIIACDINKDWTSIARRHWDEAGVGNKIELRIAPALRTLDQLIREGQTGTFDFAFVDADKSNYWNYYERVLQLIRVGGLIAIDNTLWSGQVIDKDDHDVDTEAIRAFNAKLYQDKRVNISLVPISDGLTLACKL